MELPHGGKGWQQLRQGYLPPEFTASEWGQRWAGHAATGRTGSCGREWLAVVDCWAQGPVTPDVALPHGQACLLSCVLSLS